MVMVMEPNVPLSQLTTLGLGGPAVQKVDAATEREIEEVIQHTDQEQTPLLVMGGGSNLVVADSGFPGLVLRVAVRGVEVFPKRDRVQLYVAAGEVWDEFVERCVDEGWSGVECLSGIPGWVGAAPVQNIGAYGQEACETIVHVKAFDRVQWRVFPKEACHFAYRQSVFKGQSRIIANVCFELRISALSGPIRYGELARILGIREGGCAPLKHVRAAVIELRRQKGMVLDPSDPDTRSVGSFFLNPVLSSDQLNRLDQTMKEGSFLKPNETIPRFAHGQGWKVAAAWLIERAGFSRGDYEGPVGISNQHVLALVHRGGGTTRALLTLARHIRDEVKTKFGVTLIPEPVMIGDTL